MMKQTIVAAFSALSALAASAAFAADGTPAAADAQMIKQGEYLSRAGDCIACHTAGGGKPFAGGLGIESPLGTIYSTNITPTKRRASATTRTRTLTRPCATARPATGIRCIRPCRIPRMPRSRPMT